MNEHELEVRVIFLWLWLFRFVFSQKWFVYCQHEEVTRYILYVMIHWELKGGSQRSFVLLKRRCCSLESNRMMFSILWSSLILCKILLTECFGQNEVKNQKRCEREKKYYFARKRQWWRSLYLFLVEEISTGISVRVRRKETLLRY